MRQAGIGRPTTVAQSTHPEGKGEPRTIGRLVSGTPQPASKYRHFMAQC
jgi:hypothetical protein